MFALHVFAVARNSPGHCIGSDVGHIDFDGNLDCGTCIGSDKEIDCGWRQLALDASGRSDSVASLAVLDVVTVEPPVVLRQHRDSIGRVEGQRVRRTRQIVSPRGLHPGVDPQGRLREHQCADESHDGEGKSAPAESSEFCGASRIHKSVRGRIGLICAAAVGIMSSTKLERVRLNEVSSNE